MMWQRITCDKERVDGTGVRGTLMQGDALSLDFSPWYGKVQCVYLDPPYFTGSRFTFRMRVGEQGWRKGKPFIDFPAFNDTWGGDRDQYMAFLTEAVHLARKLLTPSGSLFLHLDWRTQAHARILLDSVFGEEQFRNEIIWSYQTGGRSLRYFSRKHDTILFYANSKEHHFDITQVPTATKAERDNHLKRHVDKDGRSYRSIVSGGKEYIYYDDEPSYPDDVWSDLSQMQQKDPQRTGYATQKPVALLERIILCSTRPGDLVADLMCGSGTTPYAASLHGRPFLAADQSRHAFSVCRKRLWDTQLTCHAPLSRTGAMLDAAVLPGIGYYTFSLNAYILSPEGDEQTDDAPVLRGLDTVDQWHAGLYNNGTFVSYASAMRQKQTPDLARELQVPLLRGTTAIMLIDIYGNRTLWVPTGSV